MSASSLKATVVAGASGLTWVQKDNVGRILAKSGDIEVGAVFPDHSSTRAGWSFWLGSISGAHKRARTVDAAKAALENRWREFLAAARLEVASALVLAPAVPDVVRARLAMAREHHEALEEFQQLTGDHQDLEAIASSHALSLTDELERRRKAEAECDRLAAELAEAQAALQRAAGRAAWERHRARMALRAFDVESARSVRFLSERDRLVEEATRKDEALGWYQSEALGAEKAMRDGKPSPNIALAVLTVLALDGGARARAALASVKV